jgi:putative zinc finger/helix-turn-helix YgiT family protein
MSKNNEKARPFPWKCRKCGKDEVRPAIVDYPVEIEHDGRLYTFTVNGLKSPQCQSCQEIYPDSEANEQISSAFRLKAKLLTPRQIRANRETLGLTQKQLSAYLNIAEATLSRWENGGQIQQRSLDKLLRIFFHFPGVRLALTNDDLFQQLGIEVRLQSTSQTTTPQIQVQAWGAWGWQPADLIQSPENESRFGMLAPFAGFNVEYKNPEPSRKS